MPPYISLQKYGCRCLARGGKLWLSQRTLTVACESLSLWKEQSKTQPFEAPTGRSPLELSGLRYFCPARIRISFGDRRGFVLFPSVHFVCHIYNISLALQTEPVSAAYRPSHLEASKGSIAVRTSRSAPRLMGRLVSAGPFFNTSARIFGDDFVVALLARRTTGPVASSTATAAAGSPQEQSRGKEQYHHLVDGTAPTTSSARSGAARTGCRSIGKVDGHLCFCRGRSADTFDVVGLAARIALGDVHRPGERQASRPSIP